MHEIGHALGLTHNFRASTIYTQAQLADPEFTRANGIAGSVMEYNAVNIALADGNAGRLQHGRRSAPTITGRSNTATRKCPPSSETAELKQIAARSAEPQLAFAQDEETASGVDPDATQGDLGADTLEFAARRIALAHELWDRWQQRPLKDGESYAVAAAQHHARTRAGAFREHHRGKAHRRRFGAPRPRGLAACAARPGPHGKAARGIEDPRDRCVRGRQFPLQARIPAAAVDRLSRSRGQRLQRRRSNRCRAATTIRFPPRCLPCSASRSTA